VPYSLSSQLSPVMDLVTALAPRSVLDVGVGHGVYGYLCRAYLDGFGLDRDRARIDGIEVYPDYIGPIQRAVYDDIRIGEAMSVLSTMPDDAYDLVLAIDIAEHFERDTAMSFMRECARVGRRSLVVTPKIFLEQGAAYGNEHETHRCLLTASDLRGAGARMIVSHDAGNIGAWVPRSFATRYRRFLWYRSARRLVPPGVRARVRRIPGLERVYGRLAAAPGQRPSPPTGPSSGRLP
jgi:hypothetical protein